MLACCVVQRQELCCNVKSCIVVQAGCVWLFSIGGGPLLDPVSTCCSCKFDIFLFLKINDFRGGI